MEFKLLEEKDLELLIHGVPVGSSFQNPWLLSSPLGIQILDERSAAAGAEQRHSYYGKS